MKRPDLIHLKIGNESFECYDLHNDSFVATSTYTERDEYKETRTYRETVKYAQLYFKVTASVLRNNVCKKDVGITLRFPKVEYRLRMKTTDKDYLEYVASICDDVPFPYDLHQKIAKKENNYDKYMRIVLFGGIVAPAVALVGMLIVFKNYKIKGDYDFWIGAPSLSLLLLSSIVYFVMFSKKYGV